ncbi:RNase A-like domain-containing protein [Curtobacterium oceanosedimentum]|uniref:RNase A-like domain-containing protein n=1 Tax=Curtobacterium oceanosedimentum TaxID=465820 RepID=UPI00339528E1
MTGQCRADGLIDPDAIPGANIKPEQVDAAGTAFATAGTDVQTRGAEVKTAWAGLGGSYTTPDSAELLTVMDGVETDTAALAGTMQKVSTAISDYATVVAPIARRLVELKAEAETFVTKALQGKTVGPWDPEHPANQGPVGLVQHFGEILDDVHLRWDEYTPYVDENNELLTKVAEQETKLSQASADCVNAINGLRTDMCIAQVQAVDYTTAVKANEPMPWGSTGRGDQSCQESFDSGVGDAAVGTVEGLGGLIGYNSQTGEWGDGEWAGQSWLGFAESLGALALMGSPPLILAATLPPGVLPDVVRETAQGITAKQQAIVEGFVGSPEDWRDDPAHAAGGAAFNIGTLFIPGAGEIGAGAKVAAVGSRVAAMAADGSRLAAFGSKIAAAGTTMVRVGDALSAIPGRALDGLGDLVSRGRGSFADALRGLGDNIPTVKVSVEHAMATPDGFGVGLGRPHIEVGHPEPGSHWLHSVADRVEGGGSRTPDEGGHPVGHDSSLPAEGGRSEASSIDGTSPRTLEGRPVDVVDPGGIPVQIHDTHLSQAFLDNGGLRGQEGIRDAHTLRDHFDGQHGPKTDEEIASREPAPSSGSSAFRLAEDDLNRLIGRAIDSRADDIRAWLDMEPKPKPRVFTIRAEFSETIGRRFHDGVFTDEKQMWMQLLWDKNSPGGYVVRTAYPTRFGE